MWLAISLPGMLLGLAIAVVPVLWGTVHFRHADRLTKSPEDLFSPAREIERRGVQALEQRIELLEKALRKATTGAQVLTSSEGETTPS